MALTKPDLSALVIHRAEEAFAPKPRRRWLAAAVAVACLVVAGAALYVFYDRLFPPTVEVITVRSVSASETNELFTASGYLVAQRQAGLGTRLSGSRRGATRTGCAPFSAGASSRRPRSSAPRARSRCTRRARNSLKASLR
jgi:hypothetical protein